MPKPRSACSPTRDPGGAVSKERVTGTVPLDGVKWAKFATGTHAR